MPGRVQTYSWPMSVTLRAAAHLAALVVLGASLAACGSDATTAADPAASDATTSTAATSSPTDEPAEGPECASTWVDGAELPRTYAGCVDEAGELVPVDKVGCSSGQALLMYGDAYWGVAGGTVHEATSPLTDDPGFRAAVRRCRA